MQLYLKRWTTETEQRYRTGFLQSKTVVEPRFHLRTRLEVTLEEYEVYKSSGLHARIAAIYNSDEATYLFELIDAPFFDYQHIHLKGIMKIEATLLNTVGELRDFIQNVTGNCDLEIVRE